MKLLLKFVMRYLEEKKIKFEDRSAVCVFRLHVALGRERGAWRPLAGDMEKEIGNREGTD